MTKWPPYKFYSQNSKAAKLDVNEMLSYLVGCTPVELNAVHKRKMTSERISTKIGLLPGLRIVLAIALFTRGGPTECSPLN